MNANTLTITDNRTGRTVTAPIENDTIDPMVIRELKVNPTDFGMMTYDAAYKNTASCKSTITYIDGDNGILKYRGIGIEQLADQSNHLESSYLILNGNLPTIEQLDAFSRSLVGDMCPHDGVRKVAAALGPKAHPMAALQVGVATLGAYHGENSEIFNEELRHRHMNRLIAEVPVIAAWNHRNSLGLPHLYADEGLGYVENFLALMRSPGAKLVKPDPILTQALDLLFLLHIDHEQNCSTSAMRGIGSSHVNPYAALAGAVGALFGPLHGGANEEVLVMLREIGSPANIPSFIQKVKNKEAKLMGFGHRIYKNFDPRATAIKALAPQVFEVVGRNPLIDIARELERAALEDSYFAERKLFPNVDFYSGIIYEAMGFKADIFTVLFAIARTVGWLAQWQEMLLDKEQKISRPRQVYLGGRGVKYTPINER